MSVPANKPQDMDAMGPLTRTINRWPATILAANRTESVNGRITVLIISINTINGISGYGVPIGTK